MTSSDGRTAARRIRPRRPVPVLHRRRAGRHRRALTRTAPGVLGLLDDEQQRLADALRLRWDLTQQYWATIASFGSGRWPLEDIPWRTTDGTESDYFSLLVTSIAARDLAVRRDTDADLEPARPDPHELANRGRVTRRPFDEDPAVRMHHPGVAIALEGSERIGPAADLDRAPTSPRCCSSGRIRVASLINDIELRGAAARPRRRDLGPRRRRGGSASGPGARPVGPAGGRLHRVDGTLRAAQLAPHPPGGREPGDRGQLADSHPLRSESLVDLRPRSARRGRSPARPGAAGRRGRRRPGRCGTRIGAVRHRLQRSRDILADRPGSAVALLTVCAARTGRSGRGRAAGRRWGTRSHAGLCHLRQGRDRTLGDQRQHGLPAGVAGQRRRLSGLRLRLADRRHDLRHRLGRARGRRRAACTPTCSARSTRPDADRRVGRVRSEQPARPARRRRAGWRSARRHRRRRVPASPEIVERCVQLLLRLDEEFDVCVVDLSAGRSYATEIVLAATARPELRGVAARWLVFHRWTRQHIIAADGLVNGEHGIIDARRRARARPRDRLRASIRFVRTAFVDPDNDELAGLRAEQVAWLRRSTRCCRRWPASRRIGRTTLIGSVPLDPVLQWREQLITDWTRPSGRSRTGPLWTRSS